VNRNLVAAWYCCFCGLGDLLAHYCLVVVNHDCLFVENVDFLRRHFYPAPTLENRYFQSWIHYCVVVENVDFLHLYRFLAMAFEYHSSHRSDQVGATMSFDESGDQALVRRVG
jgi:hypothetical protein